MFDLFRLWLGAVLRGFRTRRSLMLENLALRQQLAVFKRQQPRPRLGAIDKLFWVVARRFWAHWKKALLIVRPDTVARWHRFGFKLYWAMLCKVRKPVGGGRRISQQIRELIFQMVADNSSCTQWDDGLLKPFVMDHRAGGPSPADVSFLLDAP